MMNLMLAFQLSYNLFNPFKTAKLTLILSYLSWWIHDKYLSSFVFPLLKIIWLFNLMMIEWLAYHSSINVNIKSVFSLTWSCFKNSSLMITDYSWLLMMLMIHTERLNFNLWSVFSIITKRCINVCFLTVE